MTQVEFILSRKMSVFKYIQNIWSVFQVFLDVHTAEDFLQRKRQTCFVFVHSTTAMLHSKFIPHFEIQRIYTLTIMLANTSDFIKLILIYFSQFIFMIDFICKVWLMDFHLTTLSSYFMKRILRVMTLWQK